MTPQQFVDSLNAALMPQFGYVRLAGYWVRPPAVPEFPGVPRYTFPDGSSADHLLENAS